MTNRRQYKVAQQLRVALSSHVLNSTDDRFAMVTLTSVSVSPDLKVAKIYWVVSGGKERLEEVSEAFEGARKFFRRELAQELKLRYIPELRFFYDDTLDTVEEVDRLLEKAQGRGE